jgi:hypothetical protein
LYTLLRERDFFLILARKYGGLITQIDYLLIPLILEPVIILLDAISRKRKFLVQFSLLYLKELSEELEVNT